MCVWGGGGGGGGGGSAATTGEALNVPYIFKH